MDVGSCMPIYNHGGSCSLIQQCSRNRSEKWVRRKHDLPPGFMKLRYLAVRTEIMTHRVVVLLPGVRPSRNHPQDSVAGEDIIKMVTTSPAPRTLSSSQDVTHIHTTVPVAWVQLGAVWGTQHGRFLQDDLHAQLQTRQPVGYANKRCDRLT